MSLSELLIGYRPVIDRDRRIMALQVRLASLGEGPLLFSTLYHLVAGDRPLQSHTLLLSAPTAEFDAGLLEVDPTPGLWLEVPARVAQDPDHQQMLLLLHEKGMGMVLEGMPDVQLPDDLLAVFRLAMVDMEAERRGKENEVDTGMIRPRARRNKAVVQVGVNDLVSMEQAFSMGAYAVCGWQVPPLARSDEAVGSADYLGVVRLLSMVDRDASLREIEAVIRQEPEIAFRLLQHIDSLGFGLSVPVQNFQHAVMFMGYQGLRRWLSLMLVSVSADDSRRPLMLASFRRGLILERLAGNGADGDIREEMFLLGVFSLLDRALGQPFSILLAKVRVSDAVRQALVDGQGPYAPLLQLVAAIEQGPSPSLLSCLEDCHVSLESCNRAVLATLRVVEV
ncbi:MAG: HDOD domain-containing protein [Lautropia sp.]|nr:HDOD domain-containing protein [Lautropia sp.]